eukprot:7851437-Karenia_brevis.AAC.1
MFTHNQSLKTAHRNPESLLPSKKECDVVPPRVPHFAESILIISLHNLRYLLYQVPIYLANCQFEIKHPSLILSRVPIGFLNSPKRVFLQSYPITGRLIYLGPMPPMDPGPKALTP